MKQVFFCLLLFLLLLTQVEAEGKVVINEFLAHPGSGNMEWVEFYNSDKIDLSKYWIDDDSKFNESDETGSKQKPLRDSSFHLENPEYPFIELKNILNNAEDFVVLFDENGTIIDQYQYREDPGIDVSVGRSPDGQGEFVLLSSATKGGSNALPVSTVTPTMTVTLAPTRIPTEVPQTTKILEASLDEEEEDIGIHEDVPLETISEVPFIATASSWTDGSSHSANSILKPTELQQAKKNVLVKEMSTKKSFLQPFLFMGVAVVFIVCAILVFVKGRK